MAAELKIFNLKWYLDHNPDVAAAVAQGLVDAFQHFELYGKVEGRSMGPLFDVDLYLQQNPDVADAVARGDTTAYDHFVQFGAGEGRTPSALFDEAFYLLQNPDVAAAVQAGTVTAVQHFLSYGQSEPRPFNPSIDLGAYLQANPDIAAAVQNGFMSAMEHLMVYGATEGRDLGNGVNLGMFANDDSFQQALSSGDITGALQRVGDVAPFLPTFLPPVGWTPPPDTPIPLDFVPPEGTLLVIPPTVVVPPDVVLPSTYTPPPATGGGGSTPPAAPQTFTLTTGVDNQVGGTGDDVFNAGGADGATIQTQDSLKGGGGYDKLFIAPGAIAPYEGTDNRVMPVIQDVEFFRNEAIRSILDFRNITGVREVETVLGEGPGQTFQYYRNASVNTTFSVDGSKWNEATISAWFSDVKAGDTLNLKLKDVSGYQVFYFGPNTSWDDGANVSITMENNSGALNLNNNINKITVSGTGDLRYITFNNQFREFDASEVVGHITMQRGGDPSPIALTAAASVTTGSGNDLLNFGASTGDLTIDGGAGNDILTGGAGNDVIKGGAGNDILRGDGTPSKGQEANVSSYGDDTIDGGLGTNIIVLGTTHQNIKYGGQDTIIAGGPNQGQDVVFNFNFGPIERLDPIGPGESTNDLTFDIVHFQGYASIDALAAAVTISFGNDSSAYTAPLKTAFSIDPWGGNTFAAGGGNVYSGNSTEYELVITFDGEAGGQLVFANAMSRFENARFLKAFDSEWDSVDGALVNAELDTLEYEPGDVKPSAGLVTLTHAQELQMIGMMVEQGNFKLDMAPVPG